MCFFPCRRQECLFPRTLWRSNMLIPYIWVTLAYDSESIKEQVVQIALTGFKIDLRHSQAAYSVTVTALAVTILNPGFTEGNFVFRWKLAARWMERMQQVVCRGPAEPEGAVRAEEALPKGGGGAALSLPSEHAHPGPSLQQPGLPSRMEPWALVTGKTWGQTWSLSCSPSLMQVSLLPRGRSLFTASWESDWVNIVGTWESAF